VEFIIQGGGGLAKHIRLMVKELVPRNVKIIDTLLIYIVLVFIGFPLYVNAW
jgi:hypothetical protein